MLKNMSKCELYYLREKNNIEKSLVTIEVVNNKVVQARVNNNRMPNLKLQHIIEKWEDSIKNN